ncbi:MAG: SLAC1 anion channel family protein [Fimbriimonadaceae bacterium]
MKPWNFPVAFYSVVLGIMGLAIALQRADSILGLKWGLAPIAIGAGLFVFGVVTLALVMKFFKYRQAFMAEFHHPIKICFFATFPKSLLLFSVAFLGIDMAISRAFWIAGAALQLVMMLVIVNIWMNDSKFKLDHFSPAWFLPVVGNILVPLAGVEHAHSDISWFFFAIGLTFWVMLFVTFFYRIVFHNPLPARLIPTLVILMAPPAIGFIAYAKLTGDTLDNFGKGLFLLGLFLAVLVAMQIPRFAKLPFFLSWWAYSFPLAAVTISVMLMVRLQPELLFYRYLAIGLLAALGAVLVLLVVKTAQAMVRQEICADETELKPAPAET